MNNVYAPTAGEIAREAGQFLKHFSDHHRLAVERKGSDFDFVTNADRESQRLIRERLREAWPDHRFVGEEDGLSDAEVAKILYSGEYCWVCDPLDGTVNYIHHLPLYAVSIGLVKDGAALAGAIYLPEADELFLAERGQGATLNGRPIHASACPDLRHAFISADMAAADLGRRQENLARIARVVQAAGGRADAGLGLRGHRPHRLRAAGRLLEFGSARLGRGGGHRAASGGRRRGDGRVLQSLFL